MKPVYKKYQLGSYVSSKDGKIGTVSSISEDQVSIKHSDDNVTYSAWEDIVPVPLSPEYMAAIGFSNVKKSNYAHHIEYTTDIRINGRFYFSRGIVFKDRSIWTFNSVAAIDVHQLQSIIWVISPTHEFPPVT